MQAEQLLPSMWPLLTGSSAPSLEQDLGVLRIGAPSWCLKRNPPPPATRAGALLERLVGWGSAEQREWYQCGCMWTRLCVCTPCVHACHCVHIWSSSLGADELPRPLLTPTHS